MQKLLPENTVRADGIKLSPWTKDTDSEHCAMRFVEGKDPCDIANRVAFIEKTPRVRVRPYGGDEDWRGWHQGYKGDDGFCEVSRGWCDAQLLEMGYAVPDPLPYPAAMV